MHEERRVCESHGKKMCGSACLCKSNEKMPKVRLNANKTGNKVKKRKVKRMKFKVNDWKLLKALEIHGCKIRLKNTVEKNGRSSLRSEYTLMQNGYQNFIFFEISKFCQLTRLFSCTHSLRYLNFKPLNLFYNLDSTPHIFSTRLPYTSSSCSSPWHQVFFVLTVGQA